MNSKVFENMYKLKSANFGRLDERRKEKSEKLKTDRQARRTRNFNAKRNINEHELLSEESISYTKLPNENLDKVIDRKLALKKYLAEKEALKKNLKLKQKPPFKVGIPHHGSSPVLRNIVNRSPRYRYKDIILKNEALGTRGTRINSNSTVKKTICPIYNTKKPSRPPKQNTPAKSIPSKENITVRNNKNKQQEQQIETSNVTTRNKKNKKLEIFESEQLSSVEECKTEVDTQASTFQRARVDAEAARLLTLANEWETIRTQEDVPKEIEDEIDSLVGNTKLLTRDKFNQFRGLIDKYQNPVDSDRTITYNDLDGFWEMMYLQVEPLIQRYTDLKKIKENNWIKQEPAPVRRRRTKAKSNVPEPSLIKSENPESSG